MTQEQDGQPWYREFWAWFVLAPLMTTVIVSTFLLTMAVRFGDDEITDDYYKKGRMINQSMAQVELASEMGLVAQINFDLELGDITVALASADDELAETEMTLYLDHPVSADLDQTLILKQFAPGNYRADLDQRPQNRWYLRLFPGNQYELEQTEDREQAELDQWRLNGEIDFAFNRSVTLQAP